MLDAIVFKLLGRKAVQGPGQEQPQHGLGVTWSSSERGLGVLVGSRNQLCVLVSPMGSWGALRRALSRSGR